MPRFITVAILMVLFWTTWSFAVEWEHVYECNNLPDDKALGDKAWSVFGTSEIGKITKDGELHITDPDNKVGFFMRDIKVDEATVEARVKVLSQAGVSYSLLFGIEDGVTDAWLDLFPDHIGTDNGGSIHNIDMTNYNVLRVTKDKKNKIVVYADDEKVLEGVTGGNSGRKDIIFGAGSTGGSSESYWDYVVYTTAGAFSPEELPNYTLKLAVEGEGKAATCWGMIKSR